MAAGMQSHRRQQQQSTMCMLRSSSLELVLLLLHASSLGSTLQLARDFVSLRLWTGSALWCVPASVSGSFLLPVCP